MEFTEYIEPKHTKKQTLTALIIGATLLIILGVYMYLSFTTREVSELVVEEVEVAEVPTAEMERVEIFQTLEAATSSISEEERIEIYTSLDAATTSQE